jgi:hypothetical protein
VEHILSVSVSVCMDPPPHEDGLHKPQLHYMRSRSLQRLRESTSHVMELGAGCGNGSWQEQATPHHHRDRQHTHRSRCQDRRQYYSMGAPLSEDSWQTSLAIVRRGTDYRPQAVLAWSAAVRRQLANLRASTPRYELETAGGTSMEHRYPKTAGYSPC